MDFLALFPIEDVDIIQFQDFFEILAPRVETILNNQLKGQSKSGISLISVLNILSWDEWLENTVNFVKNLSAILIVFLYDKIMFLTRMMEDLPELNEFLKKYKVINSHILNNGENQHHFLNDINSLWEKAYSIEPLAPIFDLNSFPLNQLLNFILCESDIFVRIINLVNRLLNNKKYSNQLLIPYIFDKAIPTQQKQEKGQVFTPLDVVEFICRQNISENTSRILDPACGTGIFLLGALKHITTRYDRGKLIEIIGIEKDHNLAVISESALCYYLRFHPFSGINFHIFTEDFFHYDQKNLISKSNSLNSTTILMNPPYTRQEILSSDYKEFLSEKVIQFLKDPIKKLLSRRSGLYIYFIIHATSMLKTSDKFGLIIPNSWLDVDYGVQLQQFLLDNFHIKCITATRKEKLIPGVDVNTVILKLIKKNTEDTPSINRNIVNFISVNKRKDLKNLNIEELDHSKFDKLNISNIPIRQEDLYSIFKWGVFHRASISYFELIRELNANVIDLGNVAKVRRGFTTGANEFFYIGKPGFENAYFRSRWDKNTGALLLETKDRTTSIRLEEQGFKVKNPFFTIEKEYWMHKIDNPNNGYSWEYCFQDSNDVLWVPNYVIKSPKHMSTFEIDEKDAKFVVILVKKNLSGELKPGITSYINWGETWNPSKGRKFNERPTCQSRKNWFELPYQEYTDFKILCLMTINDRFPFFFNPRNFFFDARLYGIRFTNQEKDYFQNSFLYLNSIVASIQLEMLGRNNLGEGGLDIKVYEYKMLKLPQMKFYPTELECDPKNLFSSLCKESPISIIHGKPEQVKFITEEFISCLFNFTFQFLADLHTEFQGIVRSRLEKAGYLVTEE